LPPIPSGKIICYHFIVGSLKAGRAGIDLVAASVVIHYDRWWNAAREDQATDRVHRIGQRRGIQVFKLVTEGTLEEKISALIEKKRRLLEQIVREDDPGLLKSFSREELASRLADPA
jgi:SNF2 family DNA or RNA helicase